MKIFNTLPHITDEQCEEYLKHARKILQTNRLILGKYTELLEEQASLHSQTGHAVAVGTATSAMEIVFNYIGLADHEIVIPANTFVSTLYAVKNAHGIPVIADIDPNHFNLDLDDVYRKVTSNTKAILIVHIAGLIHPDILELRNFCEERGIYLIEDSSHAHGAKWRELTAGGIGHASVFSLYATKVVTGSSGAVITTNDEQLAAYAKLMRTHGVDDTGNNVVLAPNSLISELNALLAWMQYKELDNILQKRGEIANFYLEQLKEFEHVFVPQQITRDHRHSYYKFILKLQDQSMLADLQTFFESQDVTLGHCYRIPLHQHTSVREAFSLTLPAAESFASSHVTLPLHHSLEQKQLEKVMETMRMFQLQLQA